MKTIPDFFEILDEPIAGIQDIADITYIMTKDFALGLAEHIAEHNALYVRGRANNASRELFTFGSLTHCIEPISCPGAFFRLHVKKRDRHLVTDEVEDKVMDLLFDRENGFAAPLPPREVQYCAFLNGYYNIYRGKFYKNRYYPGYQRWAVQADFIKKKHCAHREDIAATIGSAAYQELLRSLSLLLSGYPVERCLLWCSNAGTADLLQQILVSLLPQVGAVVRLNVTDPVPDFQSAAKSDCHACNVYFRNASELTASAWKKLHVLADAHKPTLISASFQPFMAPDADPDGLLKNSLYLLSADGIDTDFANTLHSKPDWMAVLASDSIRFLHEFINRVEPDSAPDVGALLTRPDPNDLYSMTAEFLKVATEETDSEVDVIEQRTDFCARLAQYVQEAGGDDKKVSHQGIGVHLKKLGVKTDGVKLPGRQNKVVCLIRRKWKANFNNE